MPETRNPRPRRVDWIGQVTFAVGIGSLVTGLIKGGDWGWTSTSTVAVAATTALTMAAFLVS